MGPLIIHFISFAVRGEVGSEVLPQVEEFQYLWGLFKSEGRWSGRSTGGLMQTLLICCDETGVYQSIYAPTMVTKCVWRPKERDCNYKQVK